MRLVLARAAALAAMSPPVLAQVAQRGEVWSLKLGAPIADQPGDFVDYACGSAGGPPSIPLSGWADFKRCRPEESGLREVYFRYDDELEYVARANNSPADIERILRPFEQAGDVTHHAEGSGLGLTLVKAFAELHGGSLAIQTSPGEGFTAKVTFPLCA